MKKVNRCVRTGCALLLAAVIAVLACAALAEHAAWDCAKCGKKGNTGNFCGSCAAPAPWMDANGEGSLTGGNGIRVTPEPGTAQGAEGDPAALEDAAGPELKMDEFWSHVSARCVEPGKTVLIQLTGRAASFVRDTVDKSASTRELPMGEGDYPLGKLDGKDFYLENEKTSLFAMTEVNRKKYQVPLGKRDAEDGNVLLVLTTWEQLGNLEPGSTLTMSLESWWELHDAQRQGTAARLEIRNGKIRTVAAAERETAFEMNILEALVTPPPATPEPVLPVVTPAPVPPIETPPAQMPGPTVTPEPDVPQGGTAQQGMEDWYIPDGSGLSVTMDAGYPTYLTYSYGVAVRKEIGLAVWIVNRNGDLKTKLDGLFVEDDAASHMPAGLDASGYRGCSGRGSSDLTGYPDGEYTVALLFMRNGAELGRKTADFWLTVSAAAQAPAPGGTWKQEPSQAPAEAPTAAPTEAPTQAPTEAPTQAPTAAPAETPAEAPTEVPAEVPAGMPSEEPEAPTEEPAEEPSGPLIVAGGGTGSGSGSAAPADAAGLDIYRKNMCWQGMQKTLKVYTISAIASVKYRPADSNGDYTEMDLTNSNIYPGFPMQFYVARPETLDRTIAYELMYTMSNGFRMREIIQPAR